VNEPASTSPRIQPGAIRAKTDGMKGRQTRTETDVPDRAIEAAES
jgi:hypothetical protein